MHNDGGRGREGKRESGREAQKRADGFGTDGSSIPSESLESLSVSPPRVISMDASRLRIRAVMQSDTFVPTPTMKLVAVIIQASTDRVSFMTAHSTNEM